MPNFELMKKPIRFGQTAEEAEDAPDPFIDRGEQSRRFAALREASAVVDVLPGEGQTLHAIMTGRYDLADTIGAIIAKIGRCTILRIATLAFSDRNVMSMQNWLASGSVGEIHLLGSDFHEAHNRAMCKEVRELFALHPGSRFASSRSHCKVVLLDFSNQKLAIEGSANLRTNSNWEQFCLANHAGIHDFHAEWIDAQIQKYEVVKDRV